MKHDLKNLHPKQNKTKHMKDKTDLTLSIIKWTTVWCAVKQNQNFSQQKFL